MNERIQELFKQAYEYSPSPMGEPELEKFAKLIIKEHIDILRQEWYDLNNQDKLEDERDIAIMVGRKSECTRLMALIDKHFGVE